MTFPSRNNRVLTWLAKGAAIGLAGGLAEVLVVTAYSAFARVDAAAVARGIATAARFEPASAGAGIALHIALSGLLGIALLAVVSFRGQAGERSAPRSYAIGLLALGSVWMLNFFVVLPHVAPGFVHLLPYLVSLASKLMFGVVAVATMQAMSAGRARRASPALAASRRRSRPAV